MWNAIQDGTVIGKIFFIFESNSLVNLFLEISFSLHSDDFIWLFFDNLVHCMAGFHRAAFIVVSHFIWRHYYLKQSFIPCEVPLIYENLAKIRHGVLALDFGPILEAYVSWLKNTSLSSS